MTINKPKYDITLVAAVAANDVIGNDNKLLWSLPNDMKRFVRLTTGKIVVMGRKTHESIGKVLPNRINVVITRDRKYRTPFAPSGSIINMSVQQALEMSKVKPLIVIGGAQIYTQFMPYAHAMHITNINSPFSGDAYFPEVRDTDWFPQRNEYHPADEKHPFSYEFNTYKRYKDTQC